MLKIDFSTNNAAFRDDNGELEVYEVARILSDIAERVKNGFTYGKIHDYNGNYVGDWSVN